MRLGPYVDLKPQESSLVANKLLPWGEGCGECNHHILGNRNSPSVDRDGTACVIRAVGSSGIGERTIQEDGYVLPQRCEEESQEWDEVPHLGQW
jgi:hypothetical protein